MKPEKLSRKQVQLCIQLCTCWCPGTVFFFFFFFQYSTLGNFYNKNSNSLLSSLHLVSLEGKKWVTRATVCLSVSTVFPLSLLSLPGSNSSCILMSMAWCKTAVTPVLMHWSYCSLALSHQCVYYPCIILLTFSASEIILQMRQANERRCYTVTLFL